MKNSLQIGASALISLTILLCLAGPSQALPRQPPSEQPASEPAWLAALPALDRPDLSTWARALLPPGEQRRELCPEGCTPGQFARLLARFELAGLSPPTAPSVSIQDNRRLAETLPVGIGRTELAELIGVPGIEILDVRAEAGWQLHEHHEAYRQGHIPHSLPFGFASLRSASGWPDVEAARADFSQLGPRPQAPVSLDSTFILYGENGRDERVDDAYLLLRLMGVEARIYAGGWADWSSSEGAPTVRILTADEVQALTSETLSGHPAPLPTDFALLDVRELRDYRLSHVPGALSVPSHQFELFLEPVMRYYWPTADRRSMPLVFYCYDSECVRSRESATIAARAGYLNLQIFTAGMLAWQKLGLPTRSWPMEPRGLREAYPAGKRVE